MSISRRVILGGLLATVSAVSLAACSQPKEAPKAPAGKTEFTIGWSIYAGWMPWPYAAQAGIVKKWADKYGLTINILQINDYVESVNQFTAGKLDGVTVASMDALTIPAAGGKDTTALIVGDYSNGNDGIVSKSAKTVAALKGTTINLVELSVSHYLLARALEQAGLKMADIKTVNTSDADIVGAFASADVKTVATWNPQLGEVKKTKGATLVFDSSKIPGEILDLLVVDTALLAATPDLGKALAGIWYETLAVMSAKTAEGAAARAAMASLSGTTPEDYDSQLSTTFMYYSALDALKAMESPDLATVMDRVRQFSFAQGLFGPGASSVDAIGISLPGKTLGSAENIKLRFDPTYTKLAADNAL
ncbi:putative urea ABC transporter substrate-binding protein [Asticcacaulis excentricus]|uniref:ABC transporter periplasmic binding protein, urea carboxylase region n=1 Tax=Asticcacaulis excentricus (strain ATCC 15261 / DSM 4724 / KCTC 12464 / NCIMB 9791 / VKM B-1370 / CB 48) TaxID=573065 RepID=E8RVC9_ASTEC|nr:putative urea ABC transporter substrate-binding protein [Asticcacaulis excentricus]ADU15270.1 ABC transporter periplasmic binding protein, urea carboxylase region [Asticcacaulis excentricus CB 48]